MRAYYNENDRRAAEWLRELIRSGLIADGDVDERSIEDVSGSDLSAYAQHHFFAGIGGWSYALRLAGWPDEKPVWTGSCPCQDFSLAGKQARFTGARDLWPFWFKLISEQQPDDLFGEQVDDSPEWIDRACSDLESIGYAVAPTVLPACPFGPPQERYRFYFAANRQKINGAAHDRMASCGAGRASTQPRRFSGLHVAGRWWRTDEGAQRLPTLVRQFNGLSNILGGFGNAIVPQAAAAFIQAYIEARAE